MNFESYFATNQGIRPWIRVDLVELYYIHEVVIWQRRDCCTYFNQKIAVRAGRLFFMCGEGEGGGGEFMMLFLYGRRQNIHSVQVGGRWW